MIPHYVAMENVKAVLTAVGMLRSVSTYCGETGPDIEWSAYRIYTSKHERTTYILCTPSSYRYEARHTRTYTLAYITYGLKHWCHRSLCDWKGASKTSMNDRRPMETMVYMQEANPWRRWRLMMTKYRLCISVWKDLRNGYHSNSLLGFISHGANLSQCCLPSAFRK